MSDAGQFISKQKVRRAFDRAADGYDDAAVLQKEVCGRLLEKLDYIRLIPGLILDAGVGTGDAIAPLMKRYKKSRIVALDLSERMLEKAAVHGSLLRSAPTSSGCRFKTVVSISCFPALPCNGATTCRAHSRVCCACSGRVGC